MILSWVFNGPDWFFASVSGLIGTLLGIVFAEIRYGIIFCKRRSKVQRNLIYSLGRVRRLLDQVNKQLTDDFEREGVPSFTLDVSSLLNEINKSEQYISKDLWVRLDGLRYQIEHLNNKIALLYFMATNYGNQDAKEHPEFASVLRHAVLLRFWIFEAVSAVNTERKRA